MITYVSADEAKSSNLAYVQDNGVAVMTVDAKSTLNPGSYRKSYVFLVLIGYTITYPFRGFASRRRRPTTKVYSFLISSEGLTGKLVIIQMNGLEANYYYSGLVWPAAWLVGPSWPNGGEIDVIEGTRFLLE